MPRQQDAQQAGQGGQPDGHSGDGGQQTPDAQARAEAGVPPGGDPVMPRAAAPAPGSKAPGLTDLLGDQPRMAEGAQATGTVPGMDAEDRQAVEQMLRRVEDDPAGLLRQRFLLQHLRRSGRLP